MERTVDKTSIWLYIQAFLKARVERIKQKEEELQAITRSFDPILRAIVSRCQKAH